jgi:hypothetical protein
LEKEIDELFAEAAKAERDNQQLPLGLTIQNEVDLRKDMLSTIAQAKTEIERRAKERDVYERAQYEQKMEKYVAKMAEKEAQHKAWEAANVEKAAKRAAAQAKKESKRLALAAETGTTVPEKKSRMPQEPVTGPRPSDQVNLTDKESRIMPVSGGGFEQCYNARGDGGHHAGHCSLRHASDQRQTTSGSHAASLNRTLTA